MKKHIFVVRGVSNSGKSHTIRYIAEKLVIRYMGKHKNRVHTASLKITVDVLWGTVRAEELVCVITIDYAGKKIIIGICSAGDTPDIILEKLGQLVDFGCDILICGCKGVDGDFDKNFDTIKETAKDYAPHSETTEHTKDEPDDPVDGNVAESILDSICNLIDDEFGLPKGRETFIHL